MPRAQQAKNTWRSWTGPMGMPQSSMRWRRRSAGLALPAFWHMPRTREQRASGAASARSPRSTSARRASRATHASWVSSASTARDTRPREVPEGRFCTPAPSRPVMAVAPRPAAADEDAPRAPSAADSRSARAAARLFCRFAVFPIPASVASSPAGCARGRWTPRGGGAGAPALGAPDAADRARFSARRATARTTDQSERRSRPDLATTSHRPSNLPVQTRMAHALRSQDKKRDREATRRATSLERAPRRTRDDANRIPATPSPRSPKETHLARAPPTTRERTPLVCDVHLVSRRARGG